MLMRRGREVVDARESTCESKGGAKLGFHVTQLLLPHATRAQTCDAATFGSSTVWIFCGETSMGNRVSGSAFVVCGDSAVAAMPLALWSLVASYSMPELATLSVST